MVIALFTIAKVENWKATHMSMEGWRFIIPVYTCNGMLFFKEDGGTPGWLSWVSHQLWLRSRSQGLWVPAPHGLCAVTSEPGACFRFCLLPSLPSPPPFKNKHSKIKKKKMKILTHAIIWTLRPLCNMLQPWGFWYLQYPHWPIWVSWAKIFSQHKSTTSISCIEGTRNTVQLLSSDFQKSLVGQRFLIFSWEVDWDLSEIMRVKNSCLYNF